MGSQEEDKIAINSEDAQIFNFANKPPTKRDGLGQLLLLVLNLWERTRATTLIHIKVFTPPRISHLMICGAWMAPEFKYNYIIIILITIWTMNSLSRC